MRAILIAAFVALLAGCASMQTTGTGAPVKDVPVVVASGQTLEQAVLASAARRRWTATKQSATTYRLTIDQRGNRCVVDVVMNGNASFSILPVESNIPVRKYDQWVNNLQREITMRAQKGK